MSRMRYFSIPLIIVTLLFGIVARAQGAVPGLPSSFYGEIHVSDGSPIVGSLIDIYVEGANTPIVSTAVRTSAGLVYSADVPGDDTDTNDVKEGGVEGDIVTFKFGDRILGTGVWHSGTNQHVNLHPAAPDAGGPYVSASGESVDFSGSATDWLDTDVFSYAWDLDNDGGYDDSVEKNPTYTYTTTGTKTVGLKVTDSQGGESFTTTTVIVYALGDLTGQVYNGNPHPITVTGIEAPLTYTVTYAGSLTAPANAGTYEVIVSVYDGTTLLGDITKNLVIAQKAASVTPNAASKVFGTATDPGLTGALEGFVGADGITATYSRTTGEGAGTYPISAVLNPSAALNNYSITYNTATFTITPLPVTVTAASGQTKVFGSDDPVFAYTASVTGVPFTGTLSRIAGENVGSYAITQGSLAANANYAITFVPANFTITALPITVTATSGLTKVFGATDPTFTYTVSVTGVTFTGALSRIAGENVGSYAITQGTLAANANYAITFVPANFTITARPVTVTASSGQTKVYGEADPILTYTASVTGVPFTGALARAEGANVGSYPINQGSLSAGSNYTVTFIPANFSITRRPITVTADNKTKVFGASDPELTYKINLGSLVTGDSITGALDRVDGESLGNYPINVGTLTAGSNYVMSFIPGTFTITSVQHSISLLAGWNLVSFNIHPASTDIADVLASVAGNYDLVYAWDATGEHATSSGNWLKYDNVEDSTDTLTALDATMGFWIHMTSADTLEISGTYQDTTIPLLTDAGGWNLVAYPSADNGTLPGILTSNGANNFSLVYAYQAADTSDPWKLYDRTGAEYGNDLTQLIPGLGYWINVSAGNTWNVPY